MASIFLSDIPWARATSLPVPAGMMPSGVEEPRMPEATSWTVPSPPQATMRSMSSRSRSEWDSSLAWPTPSVKWVSNSIPAAVRAGSAAFQRLRERPSRPAGLTMHAKRGMAREEGPRIQTVRRMEVVRITKWNGRLGVGG